MHVSAPQGGVDSQSVTSIRKNDQDRKKYGSLGLKTGHILVGIWTIAGVT